MTPERTDGSMDVPYPQYRCAICEKDLPLTETRMTVTCDEHRAEGEDIEFDIRAAVAADRRDIEEICDRAWGETEIDAFGRTFDVLVGENLIAVADGKFAGLISLALDRGELAIVLLTVYPQYQGSGVGAALVEAAARLAAEKGLPFIKVATSNDDIPALYFYQRRGFVLFDIEAGTLVDHHGEVIAGFADIPVRDELRLRRPVCR
ncbi:MAG: GNAT family N-acetyltransferase [Coriobacteriia bacterium]